MGKSLIRALNVTLFLLLLTQAAGANHVALPWPSYDFYWVSNRVYHAAPGRPQVNVISNICDYTLQEQTAIDNTRAQTSNMPEVGDMTLGYPLFRLTCNTIPTPPRQTFS